MPNMEKRAALVLDDEAPVEKKKEKRAGFVLDDDESVPQKVESPEDRLLAEQVASLRQEARQKSAEVLSACEQAQIQLMQMGVSAGTEVQLKIKGIITELETLQEVATTSGGFNNIAGGLKRDIEAASRNIPNLLKAVEGNIQSGKPFMNHSAFNASSVFLQSRDNWRHLSKGFSDKDWIDLAKKQKST